MKPYQIKRSILYAAIQGKLSTQYKTDETGAELLALNAKEKAKRVAAEKIKPGKQAKPLSEEDYLFDIPSHWAWERFGNLVLNFDSRRKPVTKEDRKTTMGLYDYFGATGAIDKVDEYIFDGEYLMIGEDGGNFFVDRDNSFIANGKFWANNHVHVVQPVLCDIWYLKHCLDAYNMPNMGLINGIAVPKLNQENLNSIMIPVPPLLEQKYIVSKIEEILPLIDRYEVAWNKLEEFNKRFPGDMQKSILQLAVQGKLVEQRPEEGTGEDLFQQIQAEKQALIKAGKIKKEKPLPEISDDEIPFDIPDTWKWVRLRELGFFSSGKTPTMGEAKYWTNGTVPWITSKDMKKKYLDWSEMQITQEAAQEMRMYQPNTILMVVRSGILKRLLPVAILTGESTINQDIKAFSLHLPEMAEYVYYILKGMETYILKEYRKQVTTVDSLRFEEFQNMPVPIPPRAEQKRIIAKLEEILPLCDRLK